MNEISKREWREFVYQQVIDYCNRTGIKTFSSAEFFDAKLETFQAFKPHYKDVRASVRQQLQKLRDEKLLHFVDNAGHYTLLGTLLDAEKAETATIDLTRETPEKREYLVETYVRKVKWAKQAVEMLGHDCLFQNCGNTFLREDGTPYIEVHHIIPLCHGGEDRPWNLSVLCAHHHRMAHFADLETRISVEKRLLKEVEIRI